jgi:hypothetical protein
LCLILVLTPAPPNYPPPASPGPVERDRQLVAVDRDDVALAEFLMEDAVAQREPSVKAETVSMGLA